MTGDSRANCGGQRSGLRHAGRRWSAVLRICPHWGADRPASNGFQPFDPLADTARNPQV